MKVLFIPASLNPYLRELTSALDEQGVETEIAEPRRSFPVLQAVRRHGKPDILHLHWIDRLALADSPIATSVMGLRLISELLALRLSGVRIVWTVHNLLDHDERSPRLQMLISRMIARISHRVIVHSWAAREIVAHEFKLPADRISVVPHASFAGTYKNCVSKADARRRLSLAEESLVFLHFGLLRAYKGTTELLRQFRDVDLRQARLVIAGQPMRQDVAASVESAAAKDSRIMPRLAYVDDESVQVYMNAADVVVMPYESMLTSGVALLAVGFGKPIIAPSTPVMRELLDPQANLLYDENDVRGLTSAMEQAARSDLETMAKRNLKKGLGMSWRQMAAQTRDIYCSVSNRGPS